VSNSLLDRISKKFAGGTGDDYTRVMNANNGLWAIGIPNPQLPAPAHFIPNMKDHNTQHAAIGEEFPVNLEVIASISVWKEQCKDLKNVSGRRVRLMTNDDVAAWFQVNAPLRGMTPDELYDAAEAAQEERMSGPKTEKPKAQVLRKEKFETPEDGQIKMASPVNARIQSMCSAADPTVPEEQRLSEAEFTSRLRLMIPRITAVDLNFLRQNSPYKSGRDFAAKFKLAEGGVGPASE